MVVERVCVGIITGPHGVRGLVKVKPFTADPADLAAYGAPEDESGRVLPLTLLNPVKGQYLAEIDGIADRDAALAVQGVRLYVSRDALPDLPEDEFYHSDLIGLPVDLPDDERFGTVRAVYDFGAGDVLELVLEKGGIIMLPFTKEVVPVVDVAAGRLIAVPPPGLSAEGEEGKTE